ncbi:MAG: hypothetical protein ACXABY_14600 [Candidatus Thorarchaeota archaeon]|jgi:hypothetical protein
MKALQLLLLVSVPSTTVAVYPVSLPDFGWCFTEGVIDYKLYNPGLLGLNCPEGQIANGDELYACWSLYDPVYDAAFASYQETALGHYIDFLNTKRILLGSWLACGGDPVCEDNVNQLMCDAISDYTDDIINTNMGWSIARAAIQANYDACVGQIQDPCKEDDGGGCGDPQNWPDNPYYGSIPAPDMPYCDNWDEQCKKNAQKMWHAAAYAAQEDARSAFYATVFNLQMEIYECYDIIDCGEQLQCEAGAWAEFEVLRAEIARQYQVALDAAEESFDLMIELCCNDNP